MSSSLRSLFCAALLAPALLRPRAAPAQSPTRSAAAPLMLADLPDAPSSALESQQAVQQAPQQAPPVPTQPGNADPNETDAQRKARIHAQGDREVKAEETQRIAVVVPNFNTVLSGRAVPLSPGQKTNLALHAAFDPFNFVGAAFNTGVSELNGSHRGFGWGPGGAAKRYAANIADVVDGTMLAGAVYPILLRQDPRFFRQGTGTIRSRLRHALLASVICRGDNGRSQPNYSNVLGNLSAGLISNLYYPAGDTGIRLSVVNSSIQTAEGAAGNIALEFSPDIGAWISRRRHHGVLPPAPSLVVEPPPAAPQLPSPAKPN